MSSNNMNESDEFAANVMAYLRKRGFKVVKEKMNLPISTYMWHLAPVPPVDDFTSTLKEIEETEKTHIRNAFIAGQSDKYKTADEFMQNEYNDSIF